MPRAIGRPYEWSVTPIRCPPEREGAFGQAGDRLGAVAPGRVHLQIAQVAPRRDDRRGQRRVEREAHRVPAQIGPPELAALLHLSPLRRGGDGAVHRRRGAGRDQFRHHPLARGADERHVAQRPFFDQIHHRSIDPGGERLGRALVPETAPLGALQNREVVKKTRRDDVAIVLHEVHQAPLFALRLGSHLPT